MTDREQILEMLAKVQDQFSLSIYKKVYNITDVELAEKKGMLENHSENQKVRED